MLIETIPAAFEMDEILCELRPHASGLNAGRWDYLFSIIKNFRDAGPQFVLPDRGAVTMTAPFMRAYTELLVSTCHAAGRLRDGRHGGVHPEPARPRGQRDGAGQGDATTRNARRATGSTAPGWPTPTWCRSAPEVFDRVLGDRPNQLDRRRDEVRVDGQPTARRRRHTGQRHRGRAAAATSRSAVRYLASWLAGNGAVAIDNLMEDAATAEISRSQIWQWIRNGTTLDSGETVTAALVRQILDEEMAVLGRGRSQPARQLFERVALADDFVDFLTLPAYELID